MAKKQEIKCPWCAETVQTAAVRVKTEKNDYGTVIERRCPRCGKVLAAYLQEEGDFQTRMRVF